LFHHDTSLLSFFIRAFSLFAVSVEWQFFCQFLKMQRYFATAVGKNKQGAKGELEKLDLATMTCRQAVNEVAKM
jgi:hypothetical protein